MALEYITTRELEDSSGKPAGKIKIMKLKEETEANVEFTCPSCGYTEKRKEAWAEPFVEGTGKNQKFNVKCNKCGSSVKLMKLKKEVRKKK
jgi:predicted RNA-binding Zn-ribbon protein involved in translation (DUF1610 family)